MYTGYFEEIEIGTTTEFGTRTVDRAEIIEFAEQFDPQPFHLDPSAAEDSVFGELVASGWHTASLTMRVMVENGMNDSRAMGAVGVDELRWPEPVRPGDTLTVTGTVEDKQPWSDKLGLVLARTTVTVDERTVMSMVGRVLVERRPAETR
ncbi:MaoC family dehydratase [Halocatena halophila]|uniref:MaoC family dehydratase n=1 Tax=Halocatena halophila TaxID=2814576 RepID=UPI002ED49E4A